LRVFNAIRIVAVARRQDGVERLHERFRVGCHADIKVFGCTRTHAKTQFHGCAALHEIERNDSLALRTRERCAHQRMREARIRPLDRDAVLLGML
jgi:hypothetical protein